MTTSDRRASQLASVLALVQDLTELSDRDSLADLFGHAFTTLARAIPFDVAVSVLVEQNLDTYLSVRGNAGSQVGERLIERVRAVLASVIPAEFARLDLVVKDERSIPGGDDRVTGLPHDVHATLRQERRTAGVIMASRSSSPFSEDEHRIMDIFAAQVSMLLDSLRAREKILSLVDVDDLTGVPNRRSFRRQFTRELERTRVYGEPLSLLLLDVDDFKKINDTYGHGTGDVVLSELCGALRHWVRTPDSISRLGGDEFAVLLPHTDEKEARSVAERFLQGVRELAILDMENRKIRCTVSIGFTQVREGDQGINEVIARADAYLYEAKRQGKDRFSD